MVHVVISQTHQLLSVLLLLLPLILGHVCRTQQFGLLKELLHASSAVGEDPLVGLMRARASLTLIKAAIEEPHCEYSAVQGSQQHATLHAAASFFCLLVPMPLCAF